MAVTTTLSASVAVRKTDSGDYVVTVSVVDDSGTKLHTEISGPLESEDAYWRLGNRRSSLENLGIPASLTAAALELRDWWETDRFVVVYKRYSSTERHETPTLEQAWSFAESTSEYGEGAPYEIRALDNDRLLYEQRKAGEWIRIAEDLPPIVELAKT